MSQTQYVDGYKSKLSLRETQQAIKVIKDTFQVLLAQGLHLERVTAPVLVPAASGINDDLSGVERKVSFSVKELSEAHAEVVQSLAKWKRVALGRYGYRPGEGIYTDMNAIRRDDNICKRRCAASSRRLPTPTSCCSKNIRCSPPKSVRK